MKRGEAKGTRSLVDVFLVKSLYCHQTLNYQEVSYFDRRNLSAM